MDIATQRRSGPHIHPLAFQKTEAYLERPLSWPLGVGVGTSFITQVQGEHSTKARREKPLVCQQDRCGLRFQHPEREQVCSLSPDDSAASNVGLARSQRGVSKVSLRGTQHSAGDVQLFKPISSTSPSTSFLCTHIHLCDIPTCLSQMAFGVGGSLWS